MVVKALEKQQEQEAVYKPWFFSVLLAIGLILAWIAVAFLWTFMKVSEALYAVAWEAKERLWKAW